MMFAIRHVAGLGRIPTHRTSATKWLLRHGIPITSERCNGGHRETIDPADLPGPERRAVIAHLIERDGLPAGQYDDDAHAAFLAHPRSMRTAAERKAAIARFVVGALARGAKAVEAHHMARAEFGAKGTSTAALKRLSKAVEGVDPINFAPALVAGHTGRTTTAPVSEEAWRLFLSIVERAAPTFPLVSAWRDVRDVAPARGWAWPSYRTVARRWNALAEAERRALRHGGAEAARSLTIPARRDKTTIGALEWVSLDGRMLDFWVDFGDGRAVRPIMLALVDVASNRVLDYALARTENATDTVRLIKRTCQRFGIFDRLYTDNGSAFAGHLVAGGAPHRFRNAGRRADAPAPPGVCTHLGIELRFALPKNARAKIAERAFATLSRVIDDRPEFRGAHAGHAPGASPGADVVPVPIDAAAAVIRREVGRHNAEPGRRSQGARGRSYEAVFEAGMRNRVPIRPTAQQLYRAGLAWKWVAVDRNGQVTVDGWTYGGPDTQEALLRHHGDGRRVLLGRDPDDLRAPALAFNADLRLVCEGIEAIVPGAYGSMDGIRQAARNAKAARMAVAAAEAANATLSDAEFEAALAHLPQPGDDPRIPEPPRRVVAGRFGAPLRERADTAPRDVADASEDGDAIPAEFRANMDAALARLSATGGQLP